MCVRAGTGKTTMLSRMAGLVGAQLVSFNLSQQTDSSDLLGGFKPVEPRDALAPLLPTFASLIRRTWTKWVPGLAIRKCAPGAFALRTSWCLAAVHARVWKGVYNRYVGVHTGARVYGIGS